MTVNIDNLTEFGLVALLDCIRGVIFCLEIEDGPCYLVAPKLKKLKETKSKHNHPCFKVAAVDFAALDRAFMYYGYTVI